MKRAIWGVAATIGVIAVGLIAALVAGESEPEGLATVAASGGSAVAGASGASTSSSTTAAPATTTTTARPTATAVPTAVPPTTSVPTTTATTVPATTTGTVDTSGRPGPACAPSMFSATVTTSKAAYAVSEPVQATSVFRNVSGQTCYWSTDMGGFDILDASGASVAIPAVRILDAFRWVPLPAGDSTTETWTWDQSVCRGMTPCVAATPGRYTFVVNLQRYGSGRATFDITA
ncbi:MAG: hypothetical protein ACRD2W_20320 [Acidimicrobiales bacterium]